MAATGRGGGEIVPAFNPPTHGLPVRPSLTSSHCHAIGWGDAVTRLFISHSGTENLEALAFRDWLIGEGWSEEDVFIDLHGIGAGERWRDTLRKANAACEAVVLLASPASLASTECRLELRMA